jgi:hypothetical protein
MPDNIPPVFIKGAKLPDTFIGNLIVVISTRPVPGIEERIGCRLELLMSNQVDRAIGIDVMIGTTRNSAEAQVGTGIRLGCVNCVLPHRVMPGTEVVDKRATKIIQAGWYT